MDDQVSRIVYLLKRLRSGAISPAEQEELEIWAKADPLNRKLLRDVEQPSRLLRELRAFYTASDAAVLQKLRASGLLPTDVSLPEAQRSEEHASADFGPYKGFRIRWPRIIWPAAAAIAGFSLWMMFNLQEPERVGSSQPAGITQRDIAPAQNRAILTLGSGEVVYLDSAEGRILMQQNLQVNMFAGTLQYTGATTAPEEHVLSTPKGGQYRLMLPDGTQVWLNAASSIRFPTTFETRKREVFITGEAYLEVQHDSGRPFLVHTSATTVEVLGTSFNINAYQDEQRVRTTLVKGSVRIRAGKQARLTLEPGQQAEVIPVTTAAAEEPQLILHPHPDMDKVLAWKHALFNFEGSTLQEVMRQLARWYDLEVVYEGAVPGLEFGGEMSRNVPLSEVLRGLHDMKVPCRLEGRKLIIMEDTRK